MKKHLFIAMAAILCPVMLISCSSSSAKAKITVTEDDAEYLADVINFSHLGEKGNDFIQIVPGTYDVVSKDGLLSTTISLKIVEGKKYPSFKADEFSLYVTDVEDKYIKIENEKVEFKAEEKDAAYRALCNASIGQVIDVTFKYTATNADEINKILESIHSCEVELVIEEPDDY